MGREGTEKGCNFLNKNSWVCIFIVNELSHLRLFAFSSLLCVISISFGSLVYFSLHLPDLYILIFYFLFFSCFFVYFWNLYSVHNWFVFLWTNERLTHVYFLYQPMFDFMISSYLFPCSLLCFLYFAKLFVM